MHKYHEQIDDLRDKRRKVNSNIMKEVGGLIGHKVAYAKLSGNRFVKVKKFVKEVKGIEDAIRALKTAGKAVA